MGSVQKNLYSQLKPPLWQDFSRPASLIFLAIHKVLLQKFASPGEKIPRQIEDSRL